MAKAKTTVKKVVIHAKKIITKVLKKKPAPKPVLKVHKIVKKAKKTVKKAAKKAAPKKIARAKKTAHIAIKHHIKVHGNKKNSLHRFKVGTAKGKVMPPKVWRAVHKMHQEKKAVVANTKDGNIGCYHYLLVYVTKLSKAKCCGAQKKIMKNFIKHKVAANKKANKKTAKKPAHKKAAKKPAHKKAAPKKK